MFCEKNKIISAVACCLLTGVMVTACSDYGGEYLGKGSSEPVERTYRITEKHLYHIGDSIDLMVPLPGNEKNIFIQYTVNSVTLYSTPTEAGVTKEQINMVDYPKNLNLSIEEIMNSPMIVADMTITNVNDEDPTVSRFCLVEKKENGEIEGISTPCYYSQGEDVGGAKYYHYTLLPGQSTDMKMGWYINPQDYKFESIYLTDNLNGDEEITNYVDLGLAESGGIK